MKTTTFIKSIILIAAISFVSCTKEETTTPDSGYLTNDDATANAKMDAVTGDVTLIAEDQLTQQSSARLEAPPTILPSCASVTTVISGNTWTSTIDFGTTGCQFTNGHGAVLRGQMIVTGSTDFSQSPYVWTYSFNNFYYDNILVEGTKTLSRTVHATTANPNPHPVVVVDLDLHLTFPNGNEYDRTGTRTWELIVGYDTPLVFADNVYLATGSWTTVGQNGSHLSTITTPLRFEIACQYRLVSGVIRVERNGHTADLNYGTGTCDNNATITIDGGTPYPFTFGH
jgi:hypothetical protein